MLTPYIVHLTNLDFGGKKKRNTKINDGIV